VKTLWIISGGYEAVPGIARAKEMGLHVVVSDGSETAPGLKLADERVIVSTYDVEWTVREALLYHRQVRRIDGVVSMAADVPLTVASVAKELALPGIPVESARLSMDKAAMKDRFSSEGIPIPWYSSVSSPLELEEIAKIQKKPLVVKPVDSRGARGVTRLTRRENAAWAFEEARRNSPTSRVMVEEFLEGPQVSTESVLMGGIGYTPGFGDRNYDMLRRFSPYLIENGGQQPSALWAVEVAAIKNLAERAGIAMGIATGIVKGDMVLTADGPKVIEMAARLSGGWFSTDQIPTATGVDLIGAAIRLALGEEVDGAKLVPRFSKGVAIRYFWPKPGRVVAIRNAERVRGLPWVHRLGLFVAPGDDLDPVTDHTKRAGFVITTGRDRLQAVERAERAVREVEIETVPAWPADAGFAASAPGIGTRDSRPSAPSIPAAH